MMRNKDFATLSHPEQIELVCLRAGDLLGFKDFPTTGQIFQKAQELGLDLCPPEVGPELRLKYQYGQTQTPDEWIYIGMKPIAGSDGNPRMFELGYADRMFGVRKDDDEPYSLRDLKKYVFWLRSYHMIPDGKWTSYDKFVFRLRK
jgi:hypothetical protein